MWSNGVADYDFPTVKSITSNGINAYGLRGAIRQFECSFAKRYSDFRNKMLTCEEAEKALKDRENSE